MVFSIPLPMYVYVGLSFMNVMRFYSVRIIRTMKQRKSQPTKNFEQLNICTYAEILDVHLCTSTNGKRIKHL